MAIKPFNSVGGFSVGESPANVILANGDITTSNANISANLYVINTANVGNLRTDNLLYANGNPWDFQEAAGSNTYIQYNMGNDFAASANFTYDDSLQLLSVLGNANVTKTLIGNVANFSGNLTSLNANLGNLATANYVNVATQLNGNVANFSGNLTSLNANLGNLAEANFVNVASNLVVSGKSNLGPIGNVYVTGGTSGQVISTDGAGNLSFVTIDTYQIQNGNSNVVVAANSNVTVAANGINVLTVSGYGGNAANNITNIAGQLGVSGNVTAPNFIGNVVGNISGNIVIPGSNTGVVFNDDGNANSTLGFTFDKTSNAVTANGNLTVNNANLGNLATANFINVSSNLNVTDTMEAGNVRTDNLLYANGNPWDLQEAAGANTQIQYNDGNNDFGASANLVFDYVASNLTVTGNIIATGSFIGNITGNITAPGANTQILFNDANVTNAVANFSYDKAYNAGGGELNVGNTVGGQIITDNVYASYGNIGNLDVTTDIEAGGNISTTGTGGDITMSGGNITGVNNISANSANISGNTTTNNLTVNVALSGNTANFSGNISSLNANLGNIADANYIRTQQLYNGTANIDIINNGNIAFSPTIGNVMIVSSAGANIVGYVSANGNGTFGAIKSNSVTAQGGNLELYSEQAGNTYIQLRPYGDGTVDVGNVRITSLAMPNASTDAATKQYVDDVAQGLNVHDSALAATANSLANLTGGTITYNNGASGVGANLVLSGTPTANYLSANVFDGNVTAVANSRILVKDEANAAFNGVYVVSNATVLTRADDYNTVPEVEAGDFIFVQDGTTYNDSGWVQTSVVTTIGTDPILFTQFSGAGTYQAGQGLTLTGTVFSVNVDNITTEISGGNVIVKANAQFTTPNIGAATGTSVDLTGNVLAGNINSNAKVTGVDFEATGNIIAANISANANLVVNNATVNLELSGNTANFSGNVIVPNLAVNLELAGNTANFSGNVIVPNLTVNLELSGNTANFSGNIVALNTNAGNLLTANFANIASNITTSNLTVNLELSGNTANFSGNIVSLNANLGNLATANFFTGTLINGSSNIAIPTANGNINLTVGGNTSLVVTATGANIAGNLDVTGNFNVTTLTANTLSANTSVVVGDSTIEWGTVTTTSITANQTIATYNVTGVTGLEFIVKGIDATGSKYSMATVQAVTDGSSVDYSTFSTVNLGGLTGVLAVNIVSGNVALQVTPASSNSTVWVTQVRFI